MDALEVLKQSPAVIETVNGSLIRNPHLAILNQAQDRCGKFAAKFSMSPAFEYLAAAPHSPEFESAFPAERGLNHRRGAAVHIDRSPGHV